MRAKLPDLTFHTLRYFYISMVRAQLGISRAFAYEAVNNGDIPSIRIGRRILVPKIALERMLGSAGTAPSA